MAKILQFPGASAPEPGPDPGSGEIIQPTDERKPPKFGFTRVRRRQRGDSPDQMDLFAPGQSQVLAFPGAASAFEQALASDEAGDEQVARDGYQAAIDTGDCVADAYCNLGILEFVAGHTTLAFSCFRQALKHDQRHWESHYNLGNLYFDEGQRGPARVHYEVAAEICDDFRNIYFNLALVLALEGEYGGAVDALERYRTLAPEEEAEAAEELLDTLRASQAHSEARRSPAD